MTEYVRIGGNDYEVVDRDYFWEANDAQKSKPVAWVISGGDADEDLGWNFSPEGKVGYYTVPIDMVERRRTIPSELGTLVRRLSIVYAKTPTGWHGLYRTDAGRGLSVDAHYSNSEFQEIIQGYDEGDIEVLYDPTKEVS